MPYGDIGKHMNKVSVGEPADGTPPYKGNLRSKVLCSAAKQLLQSPFRRDFYPKGDTDSLCSAMV